MSGKFLKIVCSQVVALAVHTPVAAQSEVPAGFLRKGPSFQQRVEQRLEDHEDRLMRLEVVSTPRRSATSGSGKNPVRPSAKAPVTARNAVGRPSNGKTASKTTPKAVAKSKTKPPTSKSTASGTHTVQSGETPSSIARRYSVNVARLMQANGLSDGAVIRPGQKLVIPGAGKASAPTPAMAATAPADKTASPPAKAPGAYGKHTVQRGDTVRGLAARFGMSEKEFMKLNGLASATKLRAGATVKYPLGATAAETAEAFAHEDAPAATLPSGWRWHTVERGESLSQIAARYGQDRVVLERANDLTPGSAIHEGLRLKIPPPEATLDPPEAETARPPAGEDHSVLGYTVQKGDTVDKLAETFATTPAILRKLNRLTTNDSLASGRRIVVPNNLFE